MAGYGSYDAWKLATPWDEGNGPCAFSGAWYACDNAASEDCICRQCGGWFCEAHYIAAVERCEGCAEEYAADTFAAWDDVDYKIACRVEALWVEHERAGLSAWKEAT